MALGRRNEERQGELWIATPNLPVSSGHAFYVKLNELLADGGFDEWIEGLCEPYYAKSGRPGFPPGFTSACCWSATSKGSLGEQMHTRTAHLLGTEWHGIQLIPCTLCVQCTPVSLTEVLDVPAIKALMESRHF